MADAHSTRGPDIRATVNSPPPWKIKIIKTADEYSEALAKVTSLMDAIAGSKQEEELELWSLLVERYEQEHFVINHPDPVEAIKFRMESDPALCKAR